MRALATSVWLIWRCSVFDQASGPRARRRHRTCARFGSRSTTRRPAFLPIAVLGRQDDPVVVHANVRGEEVCERAHVTAVECSGAQDDKLTDLLAGLKGFEVGGLQLVCGQRSLLLAPTLPGGHQLLDGSAYTTKRLLLLRSRVATSRWAQDTGRDGCG
jgi:hypothetical protein